jgi:hypothetical protein
MPTSQRDRQHRRQTLRPHPARDEIIGVMRSYGRPLSPTRLAEITGRTLGQTAYHVRTLVTAGVLDLADEGRVRGAVEHFYALVHDPGRDDVELVDPVRQLLQLCGALAVPTSDGSYPRPAKLDDKARGRLQGLIDQLRPEVRSIVAASTERDHG